MDLKNIESWGRELLEHEAAKRGVRSPEVYSRTELVRLILKHDYGAPRNVKEAARLVGGILSSAKQVLKNRLGPPPTPRVKTYVGSAKEAPSGAGAEATSRGQGARDAAQALGGDATSRSADGTREAKHAPGTVLGVDQQPETRAARAPARSGRAPQDLERSYVGDRKLDVPASVETSGASVRPEIEHSYVGGRKLDLSGVAAEGAAVRDVEWSHVGDRSANQLSTTDAAHERPAEDADALRAAEQARAEARELRRESERVRSETRTAGQQDVERRPDPGWHRVRLGRDLPPLAAKAESRGEVPARDADAVRDDVQLKSADAGAARGDAQLKAADAGAARDDAQLKSADAAADAAAARDDAQLKSADAGAAPDDARLKAADASAARDDAQLKSADAGAARADAQLKAADAGAARADAQLKFPESGAIREGGDASVPHLRLVEPLASSVDEVRPTSADSAAVAPSAPESTEHLTYGPHPQDGLRLQWRVTSEAIDRARKLLGSKGELAIRIVAVRVEQHAVVKTDVIDHGPVEEAGNWTAPLSPSEAKFVSSIGLKSATKFVSIVHAKS